PAYTSAEMTASPLEPLGPDGEPRARSWWLPLAAVATCVVLAGGAVIALTSSSGSPAPGPGTPPALVVPTAARATPGASAAVPRSANSGHVPPPSGSATRPAAST